jgi:RHS repeat-associated protein
MSAQKTTYGAEKIDFAGNQPFPADYAKQRELTNHLGNVLAVVSDRKIAVEDLGNPGTVEYYEADIVSAQDYYPFGMIMPGRSVSAGEYRYGFNSMEQDDEWSVTGGHLDFGARIYDSRLGRWLALDPKAAKYPAYSPYNFSINSPVAFNDPDGEDAVFVVFPEYNISTPLGQVSGLGHAGVLLIDNETGKTVYYEFGRYDDENIGQVRKISTPDVVFDDHGLPTEESLTNVFSQLSSEAGKGGPIEGAYFQSDAFQEMYDYAEAQYKQSNPEYDEYDPQRESYNLLRNQCGTFCLDVISQDDEIDRPWFINTSPINIGNYLERSNISISYDPNERNTTIDAENRDTTIDLDD